MARTAKPKSDAPHKETLEERVNYLLKMSGPGKTPYGMLFKTEAEVDEAQKYLNKRKIKHITANLDTRRSTEKR